MSAKNSFFYSYFLVLTPPYLKVVPVTQRQVSAPVPPGSLAPAATSPVQKDSTGSTADKPARPVHQVSSGRQI